MVSEHFSLKWNNHTNHLVGVFGSLLQSESLVDVTLSCEGKSMRAHKLVLSACSPYFKTLFQDHSEAHPIVILKDVKFSELKSIIQFMYRGEVEVDQNDLDSLFSTAEGLMIRGLTGSRPPAGGFPAMNPPRRSSDISEESSRKRARPEDHVAAGGPGDSETSSGPAGGASSAPVVPSTGANSAHTNFTTSNGRGSPAKIKQETVEQDDYHDVNETGAAAAGTAYLCQDCGRSFTSQPLLQQHHQQVHGSPQQSPAAGRGGAGSNGLSRAQPLLHQHLQQRPPFSTASSSHAGPPPIFHHTPWPPHPPLHPHGPPGPRLWADRGGIPIMSSSPGADSPLRLPLLLGGRPDLPPFLASPLAGRLPLGIGPLMDPTTGLRLRLMPPVSSAAAAAAAAAAASVFSSNNNNISNMVNTSISMVNTNINMVNTNINGNATSGDLENRSPLNLSASDGIPPGAGSGGSPAAFSPSCDPSAPSTPTPTDDSNQVSCKYCTRVFESISALMDHMLTHQGERPFRCEYCGKAFKFRHHLKDHLRIHTGERPFECKICGKTFARSSILKTHTKIHKQEAARQLELAAQFGTGSAMVDLSMAALQSLQPGSPLLETSATLPAPPDDGAATPDSVATSTLPSTPMLQEQLLQ